MSCGDANHVMSCDDADHDRSHDRAECELTANSRCEPRSNGINEEPPYAEEQYGKNQTPREDPRNRIEHLRSPRLLPAAVDHMVVYPAVIQPILRIQLQEDVDRED